MAAFAAPLPLTLSSRRAAPLRRPVAPAPRPALSRPRPPRAPRCGLFDLWQQKDAPSTPRLNFAVGYSYLAHPEKNTGEDAFFVEGNTIGVFDGVSAVATRADNPVDPRLFSQALAARTRDNVRRYGAGAVVRAALDAADDNTQIGASTACVVGMDDFGRLFGINLGDSGVRIVRGPKCVFRTSEQQHFFNCPYQLGSDSTDVLAMGQNVSARVRPGDWLIVATDGLYDNVSDADIVAMAAAATDPMTLADTLGETASIRSVDKSFRSPFMMAALKAGQQWVGGKADDITVVCARVTDDAMEPTSLLSTLPEAAELAE